MTLLVKSPLVRLAWLLPITTALILLGALASAYRDAVAEIRAEVRAAVGEEILGLEASYRDDGIDGLASSIAMRSKVPVDRSAVYLLTDADGARLAGNLSVWPPNVHANERAAFDVKLDDGNSLVGQAFVLIGGQHLLVARRSPLAGFERRLRDRFVFATTLVLLVVAIVAGTTLFRQRRRLQVVRDRARAMLGDAAPDRRPVSTRGDELDQVAAEFDLAFAEIQRLLDSTRHATPRSSESPPSGCRPPPAPCSRWAGCWSHSGAGCREPYRRSAPEHQRCGPWWRTSS